MELAINISAPMAWLDYDIRHGPFQCTNSLQRNHQRLKALGPGNGQIDVGRRNAYEAFTRCDLAKARRKKAPKMGGS